MAIPAKTFESHPPTQPPETSITSRHSSEFSKSEAMFAMRQRMLFSRELSHEELESFVEKADAMLIESGAISQNGKPNTGYEFSLDQPRYNLALPEEFRETQRQFEERFFWGELSYAEAAAQAVVRDNWAGDTLKVLAAKRYEEQLAREQETQEQEAQVVKLDARRKGRAAIAASLADTQESNQF